MDTLIRICQIELSGFKNTRFGRIVMPAAFSGELFSRRSDILGIYGQNGSGKTAVIEAMDLIRTLLSGESLEDTVVHYIAEDEPSCTIEVKFSLESEVFQALAGYCVTLCRQEKSFRIAREALSLTPFDTERSSPRKILIECAEESSLPFGPKYRLDAFLKADPENRIELAVAKKMAQKERRSFLFGKEGFALLTGAKGAPEEYLQVLPALHRYGSDALYVIAGRRAEPLSMRLLLPSAPENDAASELPLRLDGPSTLSEEDFRLTGRILTEMNAVLGTVIPGLSIGLHDFGAQLLENGEPGRRIELVSLRGDTVIPLRYESEGIIKIISILNVLMCLYNNPSMCLFIDELDAGIFEYLLGELLSVFEKGAKGQLVFTSHNLRALEMLDSRSILFSTTNSDNRYIRLRGRRSGESLREAYLRSITLGGQKESVYAETDSAKIGRAFRRSGKAVRHDG